MFLNTFLFDAVAIFGGRLGYVDGLRHSYGPTIEFVTAQLLLNNKISSNSTNY